MYVLYVCIYIYNHTSQKPKPPFLRTPENVLKLYRYMFIIYPLLTETAKSLPGHGRNVDLRTFVLRFGSRLFCVIVEPQFGHFLS